MNTFLRVVVILFAVMLVVIGIRWLADPAGSAMELGMPLMEGVGRSSQIADLSAFFLIAGSCVLIGTISRNRVWFYPAIMLLGTAALARILAWLVHDASLAVDLIVVEVVLAGVFSLGSRKLAGA